MEETIENTPKTTSAAQVKISDVVFLTLKRWPWLLLSLVVCVGAAVLYVLRTPPMYTRSASIVIKSSSNGNSISDIGAFAEMGLVQTSSNINDEINKLQSPDVMNEVVKRLGLYESYSIDGRFHKELLYGSSLPIDVDFTTLLDDESGSATVKIGKDGRITLSDVVFNGTKVQLPNNGVVTPGDTVRTQAGNIVVNLTGRGEAKGLTVYVSKSTLQAASATFLAKFAVNLKDKSGNTINLVATDYLPERAVDLLNNIIAVYNEKWLEDRNQVSVSTANFINARLAVIENELGNVDSDIASYQSEHLIPDVQQVASMYMSENQATSAQILELNNQLQMTRYLRKHIGSEVAKNEILPMNLGSPAVESQITQYNDMVLERNQFAANSSETHPKVTDLDSRLASMRSIILSSLDNQITTLETQMRNLQTSKAGTTARIAATPTQANYLLSVERQQKVKESLYLFLLQKREENELSQAFTAYNTEVIRRPSGSNAPTTPVRDKILMVAFVIGLALPFGVTFLLESANTRIRGRKDIESLNIPFIGEIPDSKPKKGQSATSRIVVKAGKRNVINEAFRVLRTNLGFLSQKDGSNVIMVTSFNPGSGKTFISMNMAVSLAIKNKRVLVIDGDLRRATTSAYINSPEPG
ncbi:MAG: AAA family ATPase, partial [Paramuribaculum sp.]|nr:AAA family ATPase [Paramuribaculum sp.]